MQIGELKSSKGTLDNNTEELLIELCDVGLPPYELNERINQTRYPGAMADFALPELTSDRELKLFSFFQS